MYKKIPNKNIHLKKYLLFNVYILRVTSLITLSENSKTDTV